MATDKKEIVYQCSCADCKHKWISRKGYGVPTQCPRPECRSKRITIKPVQLITKEGIMASSKGVCPFCKEEIIPADVVEENVVRRNIYSCPACKNEILCCCTPGCNNYTKGGKIWDDMLCPECTANIPSALITGITLVSSVIALKGDFKGK